MTPNVSQERGLFHYTVCWGNLSMSTPKGRPPPSLDSRTSEVLSNCWYFCRPILQVPGLPSRSELPPSASFCSLIRNYSFSWMFGIFSPTVSLVAVCRYLYDSECSCAVAVSREKAIWTSVSVPTSCMRSPSAALIKLMLFGMGHRLKEGWNREKALLSGSKMNWKKWIRMRFTAQFFISFTAYTLVSAVCKRHTKNVAEWNS